MFFVNVCEYIHLHISINYKAFKLFFNFTKIICIKTVGDHGSRKCKQVIKY